MSECAWFLEAGTKDGGWLPFWKRDSEKLELHRASGKNTTIRVRNTQLTVNVQTMTVQDTYNDSSKTRKVCRGRWYHKHASGRYLPLSDVAANQIDNWQPTLLQEVEYNHADPTVKVWTLPLGEIFGTGQGQYKLTLTRQTAEDVAPTGSKNDETCRLMIKDVAYQYSLVRHGDLFSSMVVSSVPVRQGYVYSETELQDSVKFAEGSAKHLVLLVHGIGEAMWSSAGSDAESDQSFKNTVDRFSGLVMDELNATPEDSSSSNAKTSTSASVASKKGIPMVYRERVDFLPIEWHQCIHHQDLGLTKQLSLITNPHVPLLREFGNAAIVDVLVYSRLDLQKQILEEVTRKLNLVYSLYKQNNPDFVGRVSIIGHSLGSVICYDVLSAQPPSVNLVPPHPLVDSNSDLTPLTFEPNMFLALGSPIGLFHSIRTNGQSLSTTTRLPSCPRLYNVFHPFDPIAYRIEPLIDPSYKILPAAVVDHHAGMRIQYKLKQIGTDITKGIEKVNNLVTAFNSGSLFASATQSSFFSSFASTTAPAPVPVATAAAEPAKPIVTKETDEACFVTAFNPDNERIDHVLQETQMENTNPYLAALGSHSSYFDSKDVARFLICRLDMSSQK